MGVFAFFAFVLLFIQKIAKSWVSLLFTLLLLFLFLIYPNDFGIIIHFVRNEAHRF